MYTRCDVTNEADIEAAFNLANQELALPDKQVEILINGAGIVGEQSWSRLYDVNIVSKQLYFGNLINPGYWPGVFFTVPRVK